MNDRMIGVASGAYYAYQAMQQAKQRFDAAVKQEIQGRRWVVKVGRSTFIAEIPVDNWIYSTRIRGVNVATGKRREFDITNIIEPAK